MSYEFNFYNMFTIDMTRGTIISNTNRFQKKYNNNITTLLLKLEFFKLKCNTFHIKAVCLVACVLLKLWNKG